MDACSSVRKNALDLPKGSGLSDGQSQTATKEVTTFGTITDSPGKEKDGDLEHFSDRSKLGRMADDFPVSAQSPLYGEVVPRPVLPFRTITSILEFSFSFVEEAPGNSSLPAAHLSYHITSISCGIHFFKVSP